MTEPMAKLDRVLRLIHLLQDRDYAHPNAPEVSPRAPGRCAMPRLILLR